MSQIHAYPQFYACYLLKSIQTPNSTATYIGSTPNPLRRIRQHNGEISAGAWKTSKRRPWVMQLLVHGFPSKQAALQFEWAWQHPHISRHLKSKASKGRTLTQHIKNLHIMVGSHPFDVQPLRVTIFTDVAQRLWNKLPPSNTTTTLNPGGPAAVDITSKTPHLTPSSDSCSVCSTALPPDPLSTAVCPNCRLPSHLPCLASRFLREEDNGSRRMLPRGGTCAGCGSYTLWGDLVRAMFNRVGSTKAIDDDDREGGISTEEEDILEVEPVPTKRKAKTTQRQPASPPKRGRPIKTALARPQPRATRKGKATVPADSSSEGEAFDFRNIDSNPDLTDSDVEMAPVPKKKRGRPPKSKVLVNAQANADDLADRMTSLTVSSD
ncbi:hypothetical protein CYLTODRAFT_419105 [Cylindrobasidium torrendii FP15055 ss-10]|uniref:GIY-YIG domain-containing protein n=1 Tax=Cylindrobasidium torrendii FP15055 ss-10 TaxID=1314674 RepID=A0A0D7BKT9_9AGAR|nr:hypothetical protein CYLTODRAFT_419105 [Cylindrobasidium torrendii FP15055 ss-10]